MSIKSNQPTQQRNKEMKSRILAETRAANAALPDGVTGDDVYYNNPSTNELYRNGASSNLTFANYGTLNHNARPLSGLGSTVVDIDGKLAASTVPNDALFMSKWGYNAYPRQFSIPGIIALTGTYTIETGGFFNDSTWKIEPSDEIWFYADGGVAENYPVVVNNNHPFWIFTALVRGEDDGITVKIYNQDDVLVTTQELFFGADDWYQVSFAFNSSATLPTRMVAMITPTSRVRVAAIAMYPTDSLTLSGETPPFSVSPDFTNSIKTSDIQDESITGGKLADEAVNTNQIATGAVTTVQILDGTITATDCATSLTDRLFTTSAKKTAVEALESGGMIAANKVQNSSVTDGTLGRAKMNWLDGSVTGNILPGKWQSYKGKSPFAVHTGGGTGPWLTNNGTSSYFNRSGFRVNLVTTPTTGGESRLYFGDSATDYNLDLYPRSVWNTTVWAYAETVYLVVVATIKASGTVVLNQPKWGIRNASGTDLTRGGASYTIGTTYTYMAEYFDVSTQITSSTTGILFLEQPARFTIGSRDIDIVDIQIYYTSRLPSVWVSQGYNLYEPNYEQSITQDYIFPTQSLLPVGTVVDFASTTAPTGWVECNGTSYSTSTYPYLFSAIGYSWGGTGSSFNVPDLRDRVVAGRSGTNVFASTAGSDTLTTYELEYTAGLSSKVLLDGELGTANNNRQKTTYLTKIIKAN